MNIKKLIEAANERYAKDVLDKTADLTDIKSVTSKIKTRHTAENISNIVYTVKYGDFTWIRTNEEILRFNIPTVKGIYRFTLINNYNITGDIPDTTDIGFISFNISIATTTILDDGNSRILRGGHGVNNTAVFSCTVHNSTNDTHVAVTLTTSDDTKIAVNLTYIVEYLSNFRWGFDISIY